MDCRSGGPSPWIRGPFVACEIVPRPETCDDPSDLGIETRDCENRCSAGCVRQWLGKQIERGATGVGWRSRRRRRSVQFDQIDAAGSLAKLNEGSRSRVVDGDRPTLTDLLAHIAHNNIVDIASHDHEPTRSSPPHHRSIPPLDLDLDDDLSTTPQTTPIASNHAPPHSLQRPPTPLPHDTRQRPTRTSGPGQ